MQILKNRIIRFFKKKVFFILVVVVIQSCVTPFSIKSIEVEQGTLAVEGDIIAGGDTKIYLNMLESLSVIVEEKKFIIDALVWVESAEGEKLTGRLVKEEHEYPYYLIDTKTLSLDNQYKLCINLTNGRVYKSDFLTPLQASVIDSIEYEVNDTETAISFFVSSHGDSDSSPYHKFNFIEDWEFNMDYRADGYYDTIRNMVVMFEWPFENVYTCWGSARSREIYVESTAHLSEHIVYKKKLHTIYSVNHKISILYSPEVYHMSISKEAYMYWSALMKYTEEVGTIFTPQLDWLKGNIHCVSHPDLRVIGYISAGTISAQRIFVNAFDIQIYTRFERSDCAPMLLRNESRYKYYVRDGVQIYRMPDILMSTDCIDCRVWGTKNKPSFWPNDHI